jgi:leader peptidase (prepilin peptidase) / N-methyltransferase
MMCVRLQLLRVIRRSFSLRFWRNTEENAPIQRERFLYNRCLNSICLNSEFKHGVVGINTIGYNICMGYIVFALLFMAGLVVGSFLNALIYRMEQGKARSVFGGRSYCPHCKHALAPKDLIPVVSYMLLRGRCRYCRKGISQQYPLVELATAALFVFIGFHALTLAIAALLVGIFVYDLKHYIIPDSFIYGAIALALTRLFFESPGFALEAVYSALAAAGFFLALFVVSRGTWMGFGDVKLALCMGLFLGFPQILVALFVAFVSGAIIGVGLIGMKKKGMKSEIPFGPFLLAGTASAYFWGNELILLLYA